MFYRIVSKAVVVLLLWQCCGVIQTYNSIAKAITCVSAKREKIWFIDQTRVFSLKPWQQTIHVKHSRKHKIQHYKPPMLQTTPRECELSALWGFSASCRQIRRCARCWTKTGCHCRKWRILMKSVVNEEICYICGDALAGMILRPFN